MEFANHFTLELDHAVYDRVEGRVATHADVLTGVELGTTLFYDNFTFADSLIAKYFNAEPFRD